MDKRLSTCFIIQIHMLLRANMLLSMASLVIFMQLRVLYAQLCGRVRRHRNYRRMLHLVQSNCPLEKLEFQKESDWEENKCAICWESAALARRLPCGHYFHHGMIIFRQSGNYIWQFIISKLILGCLLHWLEQDASCPTCRRQLLQNGATESSSASQPRLPRENAGWTAWSWTSWSRLLQQNANDVASPAAAENSQLESLAEQVLN